MAAPAISPAVRVDPFPACAAPEEYTLALASFLDANVSRDSDELINVLIDARGGAGWYNPRPWAVLPWVRSLASTLMANFPERLGQLIFFPVPWVATAAWCVRQDCSCAPRGVRCLCAQRAARGLRRHTRAREPRTCVLCVLPRACVLRVLPRRSPACSGSRIHLPGARVRIVTALPQVRSLCAARRAHRVQGVHARRCRRPHRAHPRRR